jgi:hypothetical protein
MKEALKLALETLEKVRYRSLADKFVDPAIAAIKEALAQPEQEPWCMKMNGCKTKCEDCPDEAAKAQRPWVGLIDEDIALIDWESLATKKDCARAIEAKLKELNT